MKKLSFFLSIAIALSFALPVSAAYVGEISSVPLGTYNDQWRVIGSTSALILDDISGNDDLTRTEIVNVSSDSGGNYCILHIGDPGDTETVYAGDVHLVGSWYVGVVSVNTTSWICQWAYNFDDTSFGGSSPGDDSNEAVEEEEPEEEPEEEVEENSCAETDGGHEIHLQGTNSGFYNGNSYSADDYCMQNPDDLFEYSCNGSQNSGLIVTCTNGCVDGACVEPPEEAEPNSCLESDGGVEKFIRGTNSGVYNGNTFEADDYCLSNSDDELLEYYCDGDRNMDQAIECENGCEDGACLLSWEKQIQSPFFRRILRFFYFFPSGIFSFSR